MPERRKWKLYNFGRNLSNSLRCMMMDIHTHTHRHFDEMGLFGSFRSHFFYFPRNCFSIFVVAFSWMRNRKILSSHESTKKISFAFNEIGRMKSSKRWFAYACIFLLSRFIYSLPFFCEDKMTWLRFSFVWIHIFARFHHPFVFVLLFAKLRLITISVSFLHAPRTQKKNGRNNERKKNGRKVEWNERNKRW